ncbi:MAG: hypothetical protein JW768_13350 [Chitinispirillaceae bacterium]|nr:hypothetical protein [Chitinispirillaceae bacterium]
MKAFTHLILVLGALFSIRAQSPIPPNIAVLDLMAKGVDSTEASVLSEKLRGEFINSGKFQVIERGAVEEVLNEQGFQQSGCTSNECVAEAGQILGVKYMVAGSIGKIERTYLLSVRLINASNGKIEVNAQKEITGSLVQMLKTGVPEVVAQVCERLGKSNAPPLLFADPADTEPSGPAIEPKDQPPPEKKQPPAKKRSSWACSFLFSSSASSMNLTTLDSNSMQLQDTALLRTNSIEAGLAYCAGNHWLGFRTTIGISGETELEQSGHTFQRVFAGAGIEWLYEGIRLVRQTVIVAPGVGAGLWKIFDKGAYADEPGKETTLEYVRYLAPRLRLRTAQPRLNFVIDYAFFPAGDATISPLTWVHSDSTDDYVDPDASYTISAVHQLGAGLIYSF